MNFKHESPHSDDFSENESRRGLLEPAEFCRLLLSRRQLVRCQEIGGSVLGLLDPLTEERFQVEESTLDRYAEQLIGAK